MAVRYLRDLNALHGVAASLAIRIDDILDDLERLINEKANLLVSQAFREQRFDATAIIVEKLKRLSNIRGIPEGVAGAFQRVEPVLRFCLLELEEEVRRLVRVNKLVEAQAKVDLYGEYRILVGALFHEGKYLIPPIEFMEHRDKLDKLLSNTTSDSVSTVRTPQSCNGSNATNHQE